MFVIIVVRQIVPIARVMDNLNTSMATYFINTIYPCGCETAYHACPEASKLWQEVWIKGFHGEEYKEYRKHFDDQTWLQRKVIPNKYAKVKR